MRLLSSEAAETLDAPTVSSFLARHVQPDLARLLELGGYASARVVEARNHEILLEDGRRIVDVVAGYGALNLGHNHPRLVETEARLRARGVLDLSKKLPSPYAAALAANLAALAPGDLEVCSFFSSGSEAVEAALRIAERAFRGERPLRVHARGAMHGKTRGALSMTGGPYAAWLEPLPGAVEVPFGDAGAVERALAEHRGRVGVVLLEPIQGEGGAVVPPDGYLAAVRAACDRHGTLLALDEVQTGLGRAGALFAHAEEGVVPDILVLGKSLGGGLASIAAVVVSAALHRRAFRGVSDAAVSTTTFGGRATACAIACDALCETVAENLPARARDLGERLGRGLSDLATRRPEIVAEVRGRGLLRAVVLRAEGGGGVLSIPGLRRLVERNLAGLVAAELFQGEGILAAPLLRAPEALRVYPPLTIPGEALDRVVEALDRVLALGVEGLVARRIERTGRSRFLAALAAWGREIGAGLGERPAVVLPFARSSAS